MGPAGRSQSVDQTSPPIPPPWVSAAGARYQFSTLSQEYLQSLVCLNNILSIYINCFNLLIFKFLGNRVSIIQIPELLNQPVIYEKCKEAACRILRGNCTQVIIVTSTPSMSGILKSFITLTGLHANPSLRSRRRFIYFKTGLRLCRSRLSLPKQSKVI